MAAAAAQGVGADASGAPWRVGCVSSWVASCARLFSLPSAAGAGAGAAVHGCAQLLRVCGCRTGCIRQTLLAQAGRRRCTALREIDAQQYHHQFHHLYYYYYYYYYYYNNNNNNNNNNCNVKVLVG